MSPATRGAAPRAPTLRASAAMMAAAACLASPAPASACEIALVLAHDVSHSVSRDEYDLQTQGHAEAFRDPEIHRLIRDIGGASVLLMHWSGTPHQEVVIGWRRLRTSSEINAFADDLAAARPSKEGFGTALGEMLRFAAALWTEETAHCGRKVLDVSGDGENNDGRPLEPSRGRLLSAGVTINGLAIRRYNVPLNDLIHDYYRENLIGGPGAFSVEARGFKDYARAFKDKLRKELRTPAVAQSE